MLTRPTLRSARRIAGGTSAFALATALAAGPALGQTSAPLAYNAANPTVASGNVNFQRGVTANVETYTINSPTAVIDFQPSDTATGGGAINFQNAGSTVTYQGVSDFTVLNRIVPADPTRAIQFNGTVNSLIGSASQVTGGSVWFYSPGGIVLGSGAAFNVGSLLLATGDPTGGSGTIGSTNSFSITSGANTNYAITIQPGAQINATPEGSYVALVAPVVNQNGSVRVNGSAAFVAAEQANLTINQGLFDIDVVVGSDGGGTPLTHNGTTGGPSSTGGAINGGIDNHGIYMVAVPKNTAITMLVAPNGQLGFDTAASATIENGAIYLRAGGDLSVLGTSQAGRRIKGPLAPSDGNVSLTPTLTTSSLEAQASGTIAVTVPTGQSATFGDATSIHGVKQATLSLANTSKLSAAGNLVITSFSAANGGIITADVATGASLNTSGSFQLASSGSGLTIPIGGSLGLQRPTKGGTTFLDVAGAVEVGGELRVSSTAFEGGTNATLKITGGAVAANDIFVTTSGAGLFPASSTHASGSALVSIDGGSIKSATSLAVHSVIGTGDNVLSATAGSARLEVLANGGEITATDVSVNASASADPDATGTRAGTSVTAGVASLSFAPSSGAQLTSDNIFVTANADGGAALGTGGDNGGAATAGTVSLTGGSNVNIKATTTTLSATATGGAGSAGPSSGTVPGGSGGAAAGGAISLSATGAQFNLGSVTANSRSSGGAGAVGSSASNPGGAGGNASAGAGVFLSASGTGSITGGNLTIDTSADGGAGGDGFGGTGLAGSGGGATGSPISLNASTGGQIRVTTVTADARGTGGNTGAGIGTSDTTGGAGKGGALTIGVGAGSLIELSDLDAPLDGFSGNGFATGSDAGDAIGGAASIFTLASGTFRVTSGETYISTTADAGSNNGGGDLTGGNATAGNIAIGGFGAIEISGTDLTLDASAYAGDFSPTTSGGKGGKAVGGFIDLNTPGTLSVAGPTTMFAFAEGGDTASLTGGTAGNAFGGKTFITAVKGAGSFTGAVFMDASARGGTGAGDSTGGTAVGGRARIGTDAFSGTGTGPSTLTFVSTISMTTDGTGGASATGNGGIGYAGQSPIAGLTTQEAGIEIHTLGGSIALDKSVALQSRGFGGAGGVGGLGQGGRANLIAFGGSISAQQSIFGTVAGTGGSSSVGIGGEGAGGTFAVQTQDGGFGVPAGTPASVTVTDVTGSGDGRGGIGQSGGGAGRGGSAFVQALGPQGGIAASGTINLTVIGTGGNLNGSGTGPGGLGQGGAASISAKFGTLTLAQSVSVRADAFGGSSNSSSQGNGGDGKAGSAFYFADAGTLTQSAGGITLSAEGFGGFGGAAGSGGTGGQGIGGQTSINAFNAGTVDSSATFVSLDASGDGGSVSGSGNGRGGVGQGGNARILATNGTIILRSSVDVIADGGGGFGSGTGDGGAGIGGEARLSTSGGFAANTVSVTGDLDLDASGFGGSAERALGGNGTGGAPADVDAGPFNKGAFLVATGGQITIGGSVDMDASGQGASGDLGGGTGIGGLANIAAFGATISVPGIIGLDTSGLGGSGGFASGSAGGTATGGFAFIAATSGGDSQGGGLVPLGTPSSILLGQTIIDASAEGGDGGDGPLALTGGNGGDATAGVVRVLAQAGSGQIQTGQLFAFVQGAGGNGGDGGAASASSGGAGGKGGIGTGGFTNFGTSSGPDTTGSTGSATFGDVNFFLDGIGGIGGNGTDGGQGGDGGLGQGGDGALLSRGAPVTATTISIDSSGFGGQGGDGSGTSPVAGAAGEGRGGSAGMLITNRFNRAERGSLTAANFNASANGLGGFDGVDAFGPSTAGQVFAQVSKSDATVDTVNLTATGDAPPPAGLESYLKVDNGVFQATNLSVGVTGDLLLSVVDGGVLRADFLSLNSTGSLLSPTTGTPGLIDATQEFSGFFEGDFVSTADFTTSGSFRVTATGLLQTGDITSGGDIDLDSDGAITVGDLSAADSIGLFAAGNVATGNLTAGLANTSSVLGDVEVAAFGSVTTGDIKAAHINFQVGDPITAPGSTAQTGALLAENISLDVVGGITTGDIRTANIYDNIDTSADQYLIGIGSLGDVTLGKVDAFTSVGIGSVAGKVQTGSIFAADSVLLLGKTGVATGGINTGGDAAGSVFISNTSIIENNPDFAVLQDFDELGDSFDIDVLKTATPEAVNGPVTIAGDVSTVHFAAATAQNFASGDISAPNRLFLNVGGSIVGNAFDTSGVLELISELDVTLGDLTATSVSVTSGQTLTTGNINATGAVNLTANRFAVINGRVVGSTIDVTSGDIAIGANGGLGGSGTMRLTLTATGGSPRFGGTIGDTQYSLSSEEASLLRAQLIELRSTSDALIGDMTLQGSLAGPTANLIGANGQLLIESGYGMTVAGQVTINNAANTNRLALNAGETLDIVTDQGGIAMFGGSSAQPGGILSLSGTSVRAATSSLLGQLGSLSGDQRTQALRTPPAGSPRPQGYLQANRIEFIANQLLIKNSNTSTLFGGFSAGAGGANLRGRSSSPIDAIIYGRIADSSGAFKTNADAVALLTLNSGEGQTTVTAASLFNDCPFTGACGTPQPPPEEPEDEVELMIDRIPAVVAAAVAGAMASTTDPESVAALPTINLVTTIDTGPLRTEPVISDPVTGGGNPGLWEAPSDQNEREDEQPAPGGDEE